MVIAITMVGVSLILPKDEVCVPIWMQLHRDTPLYQYQNLLYMMLRYNACSTNPRCKLSANNRSNITFLHTGSRDRHFPRASSAACITSINKVSAAQTSCMSLMKPSRTIALNQKPPPRERITSGQVLEQGSLVLMCAHDQELLLPFLHQAVDKQVYSISTYQPSCHLKWLDF